MDADVIVIGAGAAGMAAARDLARRSLCVILLEARDRVGGRAWSAPSPRAAVATELGAEFIHGAGKETLALLREIGSAAIDTGGESWAGGADGVLVRDDGDFTAAALRVLDGARLLAQDESVDCFLRHGAGDEAMRQRVQAARAFVEGFEAAEPALASARAIADELRSGVDSTSARPLGGYLPIFERLANACAVAGVHTNLSAAVRRIAWRRGAVAIDVRGGSGGPRTLVARAAIVTLPVGVLRHGDDLTEVVFDPALPAAKRVALDHLEMGHVVRVALWFRAAFWEQVCDGRYRDAAFFRSAGRPFAAFWTQLPVRSELVVAWAGGPKASALHEASPEERIARAVDGFGALLGEPDLAHEQFEVGFTHDWTRDPFARGAYSYVAVGGGNARDLLAEPVDDTLFFAGEATSNDGQGGTVNGALETGQRAAREVAAALAHEAATGA